MDIDKENIDKMTDEELRISLKLCGIIPGPIQASTRKVYEKKLKNFLETGNLSLNASSLNTTSNNVTLNSTVGNNKSTRSSQKEKNAATAAAPAHSAATAAADNTQCLAPIENIKAAHHHHQASDLSAVQMQNDSIRASSMTARNSPRKSPIKKTTSILRNTDSPRKEATTTTSLEISASQSIASSQLKSSVLKQDTAIMYQTEPARAQATPKRTLLANPYEGRGESHSSDIIPPSQLVNNTKHFSSNLYSEKSSAAATGLYANSPSKSSSSSSLNYPVSGSSSNSSIASSGSNCSQVVSSTSAAAAAVAARRTIGGGGLQNETLISSGGLGSNASPSKAALTSSIYTNSQYRSVIGNGQGSSLIPTGFSSADSTLVSKPFNTKSSYEPLFKPNEITVARIGTAMSSSSQPTTLAGALNQSPVNNKFANRLISSYGLLRSSGGDDDVAAPPMSASSIRSRAPLHREAQIDCPVTPSPPPSSISGTQAKPKSILVNSSSVSSTTPSRGVTSKVDTAAGVNGGVNFTYLGLVLFATVLFYVLLMFWQSNPANPLDLIV